MKDWKEVIKNNPRYDGFEILETPKKFCEMFSSGNISLVQVHFAKVITDNDIAGFVGVFELVNGEIVSCDGDSYNREMMVLGYEYDEADDILDILVEDW